MKFLHQFSRELRSRLSKRCYSTTVLPLEYEWVFDMDCKSEKIGILNNVCIDRNGHSLTLSPPENRLIGYHGL